MVSGHNGSLTLLWDGRALLAGGPGDLFTHPPLYPQIGDTVAAQVFDPISETWSETGSLRTARLNHAAVRLVHGRVMVVGGWGSFRSSGFGPVIEVLPSAEPFSSRD